MTIIVFMLMLTVLLNPVASVADSSPAILEKSMSDTLDLWRDGRYELLYDHLSHRGKTSREQFVNKMRDTSIRPACCFQKLENFKLLHEKRTEATVYAKVGLEGTPTAAESCTREFRLSHEENIWKMQLADVLSISGASGKNKKHKSKKKKSSYL